MVATDLSRYLQEKDKNGVFVKNWAVQTAPGIAICKVCVPKASIKFGKGKKELTNHSESSKHQKCALEKSPKISPQPDILTAITQSNEKKECQEKAREFEIAILQGLSRHGIPPENASCITNIMKKYITDSEVVKEIKLGATNVIGDHWQKCQSAQNEKSTNKEAISIERQETLANSLLAESDRIEKVKESLKLKSNFLSASLMKPVYGGAKRDVPEDCTEKCLKKTKNLH